MTDVPLRDYIESRLRDQERRWLDRFESIQRAVDRAAEQLDHRLHGLNEFKEAMGDLTNRMATKEDLAALSSIVRDLQLNTPDNAELEALKEIVKNLQLAKSNLDGRIAVVGALAGAVFGVLAALLVGWIM